jgi:hypothetical protein
MNKHEMWNKLIKVTHSVLGKNIVSIKNVLISKDIKQCTLCIVLNHNDITFELSYDDIRNLLSIYCVPADIPKIRVSIQEDDDFLFVAGEIKILCNKWLTYYSTTQSIPQQIAIKHCINDTTNAFLYKDRRNDPNVPLGAIETLIHSGDLTIDDIIDTFRQSLESHLHLDLGE